MIFNYNTKSTSDKKIVKLDFNKIKNFYVSKDIYQESEKTVHRIGEVFANCVIW